MINYLIIDDEYIAHEIIKKYCELLPNFQLAKSCFDAFEAFGILTTGGAGGITVDSGTGGISAETTTLLCCCSSSISKSDSKSLSVAQSSSRLEEATDEFTVKSMTCAGVDNFLPDDGDFTGDFAGDLTVDFAELFVPDFTGEEIF